MDVDTLVPVLLLILALAVLILIINWCISDAKLRGKSPLLVLIAVFFFFPWGWLAWIVFRPPPKSS